MHTCRKCMQITCQKGSGTKMHICLVRISIIEINKNNNDPPSGTNRVKINIIPNYSNQCKEMKDFITSNHYNGM